MKKFLLLITVLTCTNSLMAQEAIDTSHPVKPIKVRKSNGNSSKTTTTTTTTTEKHPADHILIQFGSDSWTNQPSYVNTKGGRHFNLYFMMDKPFKTNPHFSVAYGVGLGTSNIYFNNTYVNIGGDSSKISFTDVSKSNHFNKFKLTEMFLEAPVELRYSFNNSNPNKSWKLALGAKVGLLLKAYTKGKDLQDATGKTIKGANFIEKQYSKTFFNTTRLSLTGRVGYGNFSLHGSYSLTPVIKTGFGPEMNTFSLGLCVGGL